MINSTPTASKEYEDYVRAQTEQYLSFESVSPQWAAGQIGYLNRNFLTQSRSASILDCACGDGVGLQWFNTNGFTSVVGVEMSPLKAEKARMHGYPVAVQDFHDLDALKSGAYDIVYSSHSLEHAYDPAQVLKEFRRVLKPGGKLYLVLPFPDRGPQDAHPGSAILQTRSNSPTPLVEFLDAHGFYTTQYQTDSVREPEIWVVAHSSGQ